MPAFVSIRFVGERGNDCHILKVGPTGVWQPPEREFQGGDEIMVEIRPNALSPDCVDLTFEDGLIAIEVPRDFFAIVAEE